MSVTNAYTMVTDMLMSVTLIYIRMQKIKNVLYDY